MASSSVVGLDIGSNQIKAVHLERHRNNWSLVNAGIVQTPPESVQDGVITAVLAEAGQVVAAGQPVMRLARPEEKEVLISIPETRLAATRQARAIAVRLLATPDKIYRGAVRELAPSADPGTRTFAARVSILGADASVLICYMANLEDVLGAFGNRGYRDAHLEAGLLGGRAYLAAYSLEHGATGLTFYDDATTEFFSPHAAGKSPLLIVALGVPQRA